MLRCALNSVGAGVTLNAQILVFLADLVAELPFQLQELTDKIHVSNRRFGLRINVQKPKTMTNGKQQK